MTDFTFGSLTGSRRGHTARRRLRLVPTPPTTGDDTAVSTHAQTTLAAAMVVLVVVLSLIGSVMILSASSVAAAEMGGSSFSVFFRQCAWLAVGLVALFIGSRIEYHRWSNVVPLLILGSAGMLFVVLIPGIGRNVNGAQRWISAGGLQIQPAEPAKFAMIVFVAAFVAREHHRITDLRVVLRPVLAVLGIFAVLLMKQPNLGTTAVMCAIVGCMLLWAGVPGRVLALLAGAGLLLGTVFALSADYRRARITAFLNPWENAGGTGYQTIQSLIGVASGGVSGTGLGASRAKWGFLPEAHTDFVFAIIGEELGLIGSLVVVGVFAAMIVCGLRIAARASDTFGAMLAIGVTAWFAVQAFVNVGAVLGLLPITGVPLPFVSFGGSSLLATMLAAGVLVNVAIHGHAPHDPARHRIATRRAAQCGPGTVKVLVTGGGTAGHVLPALAIATALRERGHEVHVVGSQRGLEARLVPEAGFPLTLLPGRGIARRLTLDNVGAVVGLVRAFVTAVGLVRRFRPGAVVAVGGYASVACGLGAVLWRVPLVVHEQNAVPGAANRLLARFAAVCGVSFPDTPLPRAEVVGNPVRAELFDLDTDHRPGGPRRVLVFGGSLGALSINQATVGAVERWRDRADLVVHHVVGRRDWPTLERPADTGALVYEAVEYEDEMPRQLALADLVVCRAGSGTCFELAATGRPAVMVPSLVTTGGQQVANARRVEAAGGAVVVPDDELDADRLVARGRRPPRRPGVAWRRCPSASARSLRPAPPSGWPSSSRSTAVPAEVPRDPSRPVVDLDAASDIHVVNVGGAGMSAIATVLAEMGHRVSGTDSNETPFLAPLRALGVDVVVGAAHPRAGATALVVTSTATPDDHPDVVAARHAGVPVVHRGDALQAICARRQVVAVAGTHGKSTTAGLLATAVVGAEAGGFLVGTRVTGLGTNAAWQEGAAFVVEADESDGTFLRLGATHGVVTNLEADHLAYWGTEQALVAGFERFVSALPGSAVLCIDDPGAARLVGHAARPVTYGTDPGADHHITDVAPAGIGVSFTYSVRHGRAAGASVRVTVPAAPGIHNARNAAAALAASVEIGIDLDDAVASLATFAGVARRFEVRGEAAGVTFVDSYDHLPTEVAAAVAAARSGPFERIVCVFQPHRYTRTRDLAPTFADAFAGVDLLGVTELYPAGEAPIPGVSGRAVLDAVIAAHPGTDAVFLDGLAAATDWLVDVLRPGDCCLTLNAGDLTTVPDRVIERLAR